MSEASGFIAVNSAVDPVRERRIDELDAELMEDIGPAVFDLRETAWKGWRCSITPMISENEIGFARYWGEGLTREGAIRQALKNAWPDRAMFWKPAPEGDIVCRG